MEHMSLDNDSDNTAVVDATITIPDSPPQPSAVVSIDCDMEDGEVEEIEDGDEELHQLDNSADTTTTITPVVSIVEDGEIEEITEIHDSPPPQHDVADKINRRDNREQNNTLISANVTAVDTSCGIDSIPVPAFEVKFFGSDVFKKLSHTILSALQNVLEEDFEFSLGTDECIRAYVRDIPDSIEECSQEDFEKNDSFDKESSPDLTGISELFMIDTEPAVKLDAVQVPSYKRTIKDALDEEATKQKQQKKDELHCPRPRQTQSCFNCGAGDHSLRKCPQPRNIGRINRAKKALPSKQERYHIDIEQRFAHLRPGVISDKLRLALGLRRGELPFFFYRMRVLGYPPGWLEDAKVPHSGIALFNSDGTEVLKSDEDEGEVDNINHKYDISRIIEFPGFNADPGPNFYDDYNHHNVPPLNRTQMKDEFIKTLGDNVIKGYKRKKLKNLPPVNDVVENINNLSTLVVSDMQIEDPECAPDMADVIFSRPMPPPDEIITDNNRPPPPPLPPSKEDDSVSSEERSQSPTLADLETKQQNLLLELQANISNISATDDSLIDEVMALDSTQSSDVPEKNMTVLENASEEKIAPETLPKTPSTPSTPHNRSADVIKESFLGTPVLKFSPFDKLPAGDNFKVGVSDVINFENLPDSTGKYENMKVVIKKVRNIVTQLQNDDT